jgi:hypothetical protein
MVRKVKQDSECQFMAPNALPLRPNGEDSAGQYLFEAMFASSSQVHWHLAPIDTLYG